MSDLATGDCGVCIGGYDGCDELDIDTYYQRNITIKRSCKCFECHTVIKAGTEHQQCGGTYEDFGERVRKNWRFCLICAEIAEAFCCNGRAFGTLWESVADDLFPRMTTGCLAKLKTTAAKEQLVKNWNLWKFKSK